MSHRSVVVFAFLAVAPVARAQSTNLSDFNIDDTPLSTTAAQQDDLVREGNATTVAVTQAKTGESVSSSGAFTYTLPIQVPPGMRGAQPSLALVYSSQVGSGIAGMGWTLTGIPVIHRINTGRGINYDGKDSYVFNVNGWGAPDDPGSLLVDIGFSTAPRTARLIDVLSNLFSRFSRSSVHSALL